MCKTFVKSFFTFVSWCFSWIVPLLHFYKIIYLCREIIRVWHFPLNGYFFKNSKHRFGKVDNWLPLLSGGTKKVRLAPITIHDFFKNCSWRRICQISASIFSVELVVGPTMWRTRRRCCRCPSTRCLRWGISSWTTPWGRCPPAGCKSPPWSDRYTCPHPRPSRTWK